MDICLSEATRSAWIWIIFGGGCLVLAGVSIAWLGPMGWRRLLVFAALFGVGVFVVANAIASNRAMALLC